MATTLAGAFAQGTHASRPAASSSLEGYVYFETDTNGGTLFQCKSSAWVQLTTGVNAVQPLGLTGAVAASRYAGATTSGAPTTGTFAKGDFIVDQTGAVWVCTVAGTPGTWVSASGGGVTSIAGTSNEIIASASTGAVTLSTPQAIGTSSSPTFASIAAGGLTGATAASRHAGGTSSGAPASGTFSVGDFVVDQTGKLWVCTSAGTPGTWAQVGGGSSSSVLLNYIPTSDVASGLSCTANTWVDFTSNQSFTVTDATKAVVVFVSCGMELTQGTTVDNNAARMVIDSAGTPINRMLSDGIMPTSGNYTNPFAGAGPQVFTGLAAATHTVKLQLYSKTGNGTAYCRPSANPNTESLTIAVVQLA